MRNGNLELELGCPPKTAPLEFALPKVPRARSVLRCDACDVMRALCLIHTAHLHLHTNLGDLVSLYCSTRCSMLNDTCVAVRELERRRGNRESWRGL